MVGLHQDSERGDETARPGVLDAEKARIADRLLKTSETIRGVGAGLNPLDDSTLCRVTERVASSLESAGKYIGSAPPGAMARDLKALARRHPEMIIGGAVLAGLVLGRFLRSGSTADAPDSQEPTSAEPETVHDSNGNPVLPNEVREDERQEVHSEQHAMRL
jgi:hypothetical protein